MTDSKKRYDARRREQKPWRAWYRLPVWKQIRTKQLAKEPLCERCKAKGRIVAANVCNHKTPHKGNWSLFLRGPFESVCKPCHDSEIQSEEALGYSTQIGPDGWPIDNNNPINAGTKKQPYSIPHYIRPSGIPVHIVCGPPGAGKSTYIRDRAKPNDTIIDMDDIRES